MGICLGREWVTVVNMRMSSNNNDLKEFRRVCENQEVVNTSSNRRGFLDVSLEGVSVAESESFLTHPTRFYRPTIQAKVVESCGEIPIGMFKSTASLGETFGEVEARKDVCPPSTCTNSKWRYFSQVGSHSLLPTATPWLSHAQWHRFKFLPRLENH